MKLTKKIILKGGTSQQNASFCANFHQLLVSISLHIFQHVALIENGIANAKFFNRHAILLSGHNLKFSLNLKTCFDFY